LIDDHQSIDEEKKKPFKGVNVQGDMAMWVESKKIKRPTVVCGVSRQQTKTKKRKSDRNHRTKKEKL
jgi:Zn ribbon nucleic-acid-binding protein